MNDILLRKELAEFSRPIEGFLQFRWRIVDDLEERPHRMDIPQWWFAIRNFNGRNSLRNTTHQFKLPMLNKITIIDA